MARPIADDRGEERSQLGRGPAAYSENQGELTIELDIANCRAVKEIELKEMATIETTRLKAIAQAAEMDKQLLQQEVQKLRGMLDFLRHTTSKSVDDFRNRLKLNLNLPTGG